MLAVPSLLPQGQKHCRLKAKKRKSGEPTYYVSLEKPSRKRLGRLYGSDKAAAVEFFQEMEQAVEERGAEAVLRLNVRTCLVLMFQLILADLTSGSLSLLHLHKLCSYFALSCTATHQLRLSIPVIGCAEHRCQLL